MGNKCDIDHVMVVGLRRVGFVYFYNCWIPEIFMSEQSLEFTQE